MDLFPSFPPIRNYKIHSQIVTGSFFLFAVGKNQNSFYLIYNTREVRPLSACSFHQGVFQSVALHIDTFLH